MSEQLTPWQVDAVLYAIARQTCKDEGVPWTHAGEVPFEVHANYGDMLRLQWDDERNGVCLCGCLMTRHLYVTVARHYCRVCDALCRGGAYQGSGLPVK